MLTQKRPSVIMCPTIKQQDVKITSLGNAILRNHCKLVREGFRHDVKNRKNRKNSFDFEYTKPCRKVSGILSLLF